MPLVATEAVVLHAVPYLESSRILRLATRAHGVVSVLGKGARKSQRRFGTALDLFAEGDAQFYTKPGRDLHTLGAFEVTRARVAIGADLDRFGAAAMIAELVLRFGRDEEDPGWYDALVAALDGVVRASPGRARDAGLAGAWGIVGALGFAPALDHCAHCGADLAADATVRFSQPAGGALCDSCGRLAGATRGLPADARAAVRAWLDHGERRARDLGDRPALDDATVRAHQRLLREFLREHLTDGRPLRAYETWEGARWGAAPTSAPSAAAEPAAATPLPPRHPEPAA
jgi:DNA repair protein RecO (recombination protein O)